MTTKSKNITRLLLRNRQYVDGFWGWIKKGKSLSKKNANKFLLGCILDYQIPADLAWDNAERLAEDILGDPDELWQCITNVSLKKWNTKWREYKLHRFPKAHERVWKIGEKIVIQYKGDARKIWKGKETHIVLDRLNELGVGEQISRMVIGALCDTDQIQGSGDVKVDIHVRRVLGRVLRGSPFNINEASIALEKTRQMSPQNPWLLDEPLYSLGKSFCDALDPDCDNCYLKKECTYHNMT